MGYTDAQGRPEIVMHPDIVRGAAGYRTTGERLGGDAARRLPDRHQDGAGTNQAGPDSDSR